MPYAGDLIKAGSDSLEGALKGISYMNASTTSSKEKSRQRKARALLDLLRNKLSSENESRESQNKMKDVFAELLANKAAHFRQSVS